MHGSSRSLFRFLLRPAATAFAFHRWLSSILPFPKLFVIHPDLTAATFAGREYFRYVSLHRLISNGLSIVNEEIVNRQCFSIRHSEIRHFVIFFITHSAVTHIVKHSSANGRKPRNPGAGISKTLMFWNIGNV